MTEIEAGGATGVITHRVCEGHRAAYEEWLQEIVPLCRTFPGHLDSQTIRPIEGLTGTYTVVLRFDTEAHLKGWLESPERRALIDKVRPHLAADDDFYVRSGLDFWFLPEGARAQVPVRWKQAIVTWTAIYPLALTVPMIVVPLLRRIGLPALRPVDTFFVSILLVNLMVYLVMPRYTKLVQKWLFR